MSTVLATLLLTLGVFILVMLGLSIGWILHKKPLKGSCGGLNAVGLNGECSICGAKPVDQCKETQQSSASAGKPIVNKDVNLE